MGAQWRKENPNPRVHRFSGKLGEPRFPLERVDPRVGIFLSPLDTHDGFYLSLFLNLKFQASSLQYFVHYMSSIMSKKKKKKKKLWFPTRSDTKWTVQSQKKARSLKFWILVEEALYYLCSKNK